MAQWCRATENTTMQQMQLVIFVLAMAAIVVCGCIFTRPRKKLLKETWQPALPDEHQPGCFALEEERGGKLEWQRRTGNQRSSTDSVTIRLEARRRISNERRMNLLGQSSCQ